MISVRGSGNLTPILVIIITRVEVYYNLEKNPITIISCVENLYKKYSWKV